MAAFSYSNGLSTCPQGAVVAVLDKGPSGSLTEGAGDRPYRQADPVTRSPAASMTTEPT